MVASVGRTCVCMAPCIWHIRGVRGQRTWLWEEALGQKDLGVEERLHETIQREEVLSKERAAA